MLAATVYQHCNRLALDHVEAAALQREAGVHKITHRRSEIEFAVEPRLYRVLVGGDDILKMAGLK